MLRLHVMIVDQGHSVCQDHLMESENVEAYILIVHLIYPITWIADVLCNILLMKVVYCALDTELNYLEHKSGNFC